MIRFYGDSLQGFMGTYLERSMQVFVDQQTQFRGQMNNILGQTPWSVLNEMTERNLDLWKQMQSKLVGDAATKAPPQTGRTETLIFNCVAPVDVCRMDFFAAQQ